MAWGGRGGLGRLAASAEKDRRTSPPCFRSPQPWGLQLPTRLRTPVASATALVSQIQGWNGGKTGPGFPGVGFGWVYWAGGLENPSGIVGRIMDWHLNEMENEQVCNKNENQIKGCGMD